MSESRKDTSPNAPATSGDDRRGADQFDRLGEYLKTERELAGLTQKEVRERVGIGASRISAVENGSGYPGVENLGRWLDALGLTPSAFGLRYELYRQDKPLLPLQSESSLEDILRPLLGKVLGEVADKLRED